MKKQLVFSRYDYRVLIGEFDIEPGANLRGADLRRASLTKADLSGADLRDVNFDHAYLFGANLSNADLRGASFVYATIDCANLEGAKLPKFQIPQRKSLIVYKKIYCYINDTEREAVAKLRIPCRARRTASLLSEKQQKKCRAERAVVLEIKVLPDEKKGRKKQTVLSGVSKFDTSFVYEVGKTVKSRYPYDGDIRRECTSGIHFFMTEEEAERY